MNPVCERMREIAGECVSEAGAICLEAAAHPQKRQILVDVVVDTPAGITLDECAAVSRAIARRIDEEFPGDAYELHVGSPGIDRPLEHDWQFDRNAGRTVRFLVDDDGTRRSFEMRLVGLRGARVVFAARDGAEKEFDRSAISHVVVVPDIGRQKH